MSGTNVFLQSSSVEKLHSKKGTWQRVNLKLTGKKGSRATLTYSIKTKTYEVPLWIDKTRQASSKEIMAVDGMNVSFILHTNSTHMNTTHRRNGRIDRMGVHQRKRQDLDLSSGHTGGGEAMGECGERLSFGFE